MKNLNLENVELLMNESIDLVDDLTLMGAGVVHTIKENKLATIETVVGASLIHSAVEEHSIVKGAIGAIVLMKASENFGKMAEDYQTFMSEHEEK